MKTNPFDFALSLVRAITRGTRAALSLLLAASLAPSALAYGPPEISLDAGALPAGVLTSWTNTGTQGGSFSNDGTTVNVAVTGGKNSVTFSGANWMKASFTAPATITGSHAYTVIAQLYNPAIATEEAYLTWAQRGASPRCAQFNYGSSADFGAVTHWAAPDMGFVGVPSASVWHYIAVTYDGTTEKIFVDGVLNNSEAKTLNLWPGQPVFIGTSYGNADGSGKGLAFSGSLASLQVYSEALAAADIKSLSGVMGISGQVTSGGSAVAGATVYYKLSANASVSPLGSVTTDASGNYMIGVPKNTGPYYIAATKTGYVLSADYDPAPSVTTADVAGINFPLVRLPAITGNVSDGANVCNAAVTVNTSTDGGTTLIPSQTVYTDTSGNYTAYVSTNTTYYLTGKKSAHADSSPLAVVVATTDITGQNITLTKNAAVKLVDLQASGLTSGGSGAIWTNTGTMAGTFASNAAFTVGLTGGRPAVTMTGSLNFKSSWNTSTVPWPSAIQGGDVQYTTVGWVYAAGNTGTYLGWSEGTGAGRGSIGYNPSYERFRYSTDQWGCCDHINSTWIGWGGTNTTGTVPAYGSWHMIVTTYNGTTEKLYVDGVKKSTTGADAILRTFNPASNIVCIGSSAGNGDWFTGAINRIQLFDQELSATDIAQLWNDGNASLVAVSGTVSGPTGVLASAMVTVKDALGAVITTATTDDTGAYSAMLVGNSGTAVNYDLAATKWGYLNSAPLTVPVGGSNVTGQNFTLAVAPAIKGVVSSSGEPVSGAAVMVGPNPADSEASVTVTTDASGNYTAYAQGNKTYSVAAAKARYTAPAAVDVAVAGSDVTHDITLAKNAVIKVVDLDASTLPLGAITSWPNAGTKGGSFDNTTSTATVVADANAPGNRVVQFGGGTNDYLKSTWNTAAADGVVGPDTQYTVAAWIYQPASPAGGACYMSMAATTGAGALFRLDGFNTWANIDRGNGQWVGWNGAWTAGTAPASGTWHLVVNTYDGSLDHVIVDGVDRYNATQVHSLNLNTGAPITVGRGYWTNPAIVDQGGFSGSIARVSIWDQALSLAEIKQAMGLHIITATAGSHGSISPTGSQMVIDGKNQTFAITPESGFAVDIVTVDGVAQSGHPASYTFTNVTADHTIAVTFMVVPTNPYDIWAQGPFANAFTDTNPTHDPDGDGLTNLQEFAFALDPTLGSSVNPITTPLDKTTGKFRYTRLAASGLAYHVLTSTDLQTWTEEAFPVTETVIGTVAGVDTVEVTVAAPPVNGKLFVRVAAQ